MNTPKHDDLVDLAAAALLQAEALAPDLAAGFDGALDRRREASLLSRLAAASQRRAIFTRDVRADLDTLIDIVERGIEAGSTIESRVERPEGTGPGEFQIRTGPVRTPGAERLAAAHQRLGLLREAIAQVCALVDAEKTVFRLAQAGR